MLLPRLPLLAVIAMAAGMIPIALGLSGDSSFRAPMAIAVIGGLITSILLSLIVIPAAFTLVEGLGKWIARRFHKKPYVVAPQGAATSMDPAQAQFHCGSGFSRDGLCQ